MVNPVFTVAKPCCFAPFAAVSVLLFILLLRGGPPHTSAHMSRT